MTITIDKAIETLIQDRKERLIYIKPELAEAEQLGIEALKEINRLHECGILPDCELLLGETEEHIPQNVGKLPSDEDCKSGETEE